ncbi:MAG: hypothetical protein ACI8RZ_000663 [Myxococcota bacterium]|jgi:hypothetical protein
MLILALLACSDCPDGSTIQDDDLCHTDEDTAPSEDTAPDDSDDSGTSDTDDSGPPGDAGCPAKTSTDTYDAYPVYLAGSDRRFATIQDGIWGAEEGDVVTVCPGTYLENIDFKGKPITVTSAEGPWVTIIDGQGLDSVVTMKNYEPAESILQGFTLTNGSAVESRHGGGIYIEWGSPTIRYNVITHNAAAISGGIYVRNGGANVHNNIIAWNQATQGGGGIVCTACVGSYRYNTLFENHCKDGPIAEWFWGIADLVGNVLVSEATKEDKAAIRWMKPRGDDFETGYNLVWPHTVMVDNEEDAWPDGEGLVWAEAALVDPANLDFTLSSESPAIDAGPPDDLDPDGSRADLGAYGGPDGEWPW